jgi:hypothetical protein
MTLPCRAKAEDRGNPRLAAPHLVLSGRYLLGGNPGSSVLLERRDGEASDLAILPLVEPLALNVILRCVRRTVDMSRRERSYRHGRAAGLEPDDIPDVETGHWNFPKSRLIRIT